MYKHSRVRRVLLRALALVAAVAAIVPAGTVPARAQQPERFPTWFDWSIPSRFGQDFDGDGRIEDHIDREYADVRQLPVTLSACYSWMTSEDQVYRWWVDGRFATMTTNCSVTISMSPGDHTIRLALGDGRTGTRTVSPKDLLIVSMGDSLGSGEGVPNRFASGDTTVRWENTQCHRSRKAGSALAAKAIEDADRQTSVTFVHVACSGADVSDLYEGGYRGIVPGDALPSQIDQVLGVIDPDGSGPRSPRRIDALMLSIGINEVDFAQLLIKCILMEPCDAAGTAMVNVDPARPALDWVCDQVGEAFGSPRGSSCDQFLAEEVYSLHGRQLQTAESQFAARVAAQRGRYDTLALRLRDRLGMGATDAQTRVFITDYPDITRNGNGGFCNNSHYIQWYNPFSWHPDNAFRTIPFVEPGEFQWAANRVLNGPGSLNGWIADARSRHGWRAVRPASSDFGTHGYCAADGNRSVRRLDESFRIQGDVKGMLHPNTTGHEAYRDRYVEAVAPVLGV